MAIAAPQSIDERHDRPGFVRLVCIYGLAPSAPGGAREPLPLSAALSLGRFASHFDRGEEIVLTARHATQLAPLRLEWTPAGAQGPSSIACPGRFVLLATPQFRSLLLTELHLPLETSHGDLVSILQGTCFDRSTMRIDGTEVAEAWRALPPNPAFGPFGGAGAIAFGEDVHQVLCLPEGGSAGEEDLLELVYRERGRHDADWATAGRPGELNRIGAGACRHGRGVTALAGHAEHVELGVAVACHVVAALQEVRQIRLRTARVLAEARATRDAGDPQERLAWLARQERVLSDLRADLTMGVESFADSTNWPDMVLESYQRSLVTLVGLHPSATACDRMIERLDYVLKAHQAEVAAALAAQTERRRRAWLVVAGSFTVLIAPLSLAFAYFGVNTRELAGADQHSMFSLDQYGWFWAALAAGTAAVGLVALLALKAWPRRLWRRD